MTITAWDRFRDDIVGALNSGMPQQLLRLTWDPQRIRQAHHQGLQALLRHAVKRSPFHRRRLAGIDLDGIDPTDLSLLPVMTKADMMAALDDVFTDRRLNRRIVESALAATANEPVPMLDDFVALASGGCSGYRGVFVYDRMAARAFCSAIVRPPAGVVLPPADQHGTPRLAFVAAGSAVHATGFVAALTADGNTPVHAELVPATLPIDEIVKRLNAIQPDVLSGYATTLVRLAAEASAGRLRITPTQISSTSETMLPEMRSAIREAFGVTIFDSFGSSEGLFGKTGPDDDVFAFNTDMCIVELVDADNMPVAPGVPSAKVLVTNLYNHVQPLIRYELTDSFSRQPDVNGHGHLRARVRGRSDEVLRYGATTIHPIAIRSVMVKAPQVTDYQVHQTRTGIDVFAVISQELDLDTLAEQLRRALVDGGLNRPTVTVRAVDRVERHPLSGKLRRFVPLPAGQAYA